MKHRPFELVVRSRHRAAALLLAAALASCDDDGVAPGEGPSSLRGAAERAGTWVLEVESEQASTPGQLVADTLRLHIDGDGRWTWISRDPLEPAALRRTEIVIGWNVDTEAMHVTPRCEPVALCDPLPPWTGRLLRDGRLFLVANFINPEIPTRTYRKVGGSSQ
jgi:hypothetical protein